jgi:hypothetical protein
MAFIFISYRKEDSGDCINDLRMKLKSLMPDDRFYLDVHGIYPSDRLQAKLDKQVRMADVLLAVMGPQWLTCKSDTGRQRLHDPADHLRRKLHTALASDMKVLPVLVHGARMPDKGELPDDLQKLAVLPACSLDDGEFDSGIDELHRQVQKLIKQAEKTFEAESQKVDEIMEEILEADGDLEIVPGVAWDDFYPIGDWHCNIKPRAQDPDFPPNVRVSFDFSVNGEGNFKGLWKHIDLDGVETETIDQFKVTGDWLLNVDHRQFQRVVGLRLRGTAKSGEEFEWEIPIDERVGGAYQGKDEEGRSYYLQKRQLD